MKVGAADLRNSDRINQLMRGGNIMLSLSDAIALALENNLDIAIQKTGTPLPEETLKASSAIDFVVRKEFDYAVTEFALGKKLEEIIGISFRKNDQIFTTRIAV
jgi:hypothetical protein